MTDKDKTPEWDKHVWEREYMNDYVPKADKTPEELAEEYKPSKTLKDLLEFAETEPDDDSPVSIICDQPEYEAQLRRAWLAGYDAGFKAALDEEDIPDIQLPKSKQPTKED